MFSVKSKVALAAAFNVLLGSVVMGSVGWADTLAPVIPPAISPPDCPEYDSLCLQADRSGGVDLKAGTAYLEGNVVGFLKRHDLVFKAQSLKAFRNDNDEWVRLELDREVGVQQLERWATADHAVVENDTGRVELYGRVKMGEESAYIEGEKIVIEQDPERSIIDGGPTKPLLMRYAARSAPANRESAPTESAPTESVPTESARNMTGAEDVNGETFPDTILVTARHAIIDNAAGLARYEGNVFMRRVEMGWRVWGDMIELTFSEDQRLTDIHVVGGARIEQPNRILSGDEVVSQNEMEILLLIGNAHARQIGQFDIKSDRIEVYADAERGLVQSKDQQGTLRLTLNFGDVTPHILDTSNVDLLRDQGLPAGTLTKLDAIVGQTFEGRSAFIEAVRPRLSAAEAERFLDTIAAAARKQAAK
ncbi:MAG: hypothetical protein IID61_07455 [SAR324 cluster bacterium]|nr:hypothetical protein [SAR324 cluster bacterium]